MRQAAPAVTREGLKRWYDGYHTKAGERLYNPRSVVAALENNQLGSYWTGSGPYDEIYYYVEKNIDDVRDELAWLVAGESVPAKVREYAATSMSLRTKEEILSYAHNTETPLLVYNNEAELSAIVNLVYLAARDWYEIKREERSGIGYVDFIFYPKTRQKPDGIILELKVNRTPQEAIRQIKEKQYALRFQGGPGEKPRDSGRILAVGISYDKKTKEHHCAVEVL